MCAFQLFLPCGAPSDELRLELSPTYICVASAHIQCVLRISNLCLAGFAEGVYGRPCMESTSIRL